MGARSIECWHTDLLESETGILRVNAFNEKVSRYCEETDVKKAGFTLW